jgi:hypothetical protein
LYIYSYRFENFSEWHYYNLWHKVSWKLMAFVWWWTLKIIGMLVHLFYLLHGYFRRKKTYIYIYIYIYIDFQTCMNIYTRLITAFQLFLKSIIKQMPWVFKTPCVINYNNVIQKRTFWLCNLCNLWNFIWKCWSIFLAHLTQRVMWGIAITWRPSSVR